MPLRVLVVDDDETTRWLVVRLFAATEDVSVIGEAADGAGAVSVALVTNPDVIVLDHVMPGGCGLDVVPQLLDASPGARIIMFTARLSSELEQSALAAGADSIVTKTGDLTELLAAVRAAGTRRTHPIRGTFVV